MKEGEPRVPLLERDQVPPELRVLYDAVLQQRGVVPNMFKTVANVPGLALGFAALLKPLLSDGALSGLYKELIATRMSVLCGSDYATAGHVTSAKQKGATDAQIAAVKSDFESGPSSDPETSGLRCADRLHRSGRELHDAFYAKLESVLTDQQRVDSVHTE